MGGPRQVMWPERRAQVRCVGWSLSGQEGSWCWSAFTSPTAADLHRIFTTLTEHNLLACYPGQMDEMLPLLDDSPEPNCLVAGVLLLLGGFLL